MPPLLQLRDRKKAPLLQLRDNISRGVKKFFKPTENVRARDVVRELPGAVAGLGQSAFRGFGAVASAIRRKPFTPRGTFQESLYGTNRPITPTSFGREARGADPTKRSTGIFRGIDPTIGIALGAADAVPGGGAIKRGVRTAARGARGVASVADDIGRGAARGARQVFEGFDDLSTKVLERFRGRDVVSKGEVVSEMNRIAGKEGVKQVEQDIIARSLNELPGNRISVPDFADRVKKQLLPLNRRNADAVGGARYESVTLPNEKRGNVSNYREHVYESPVRTSAGDVHFTAKEGFDNYFAHTRVEDLAEGRGGYRLQELTDTNTGKPFWQIVDAEGEAVERRASGLEDITGRRSGFDDVDVFLTEKEAREALGSLQSGGDGTRRVIEIQSDLFQKGRLEGETNSVNNYGPTLRDAERRFRDNFGLNRLGHLSPEHRARIQELHKEHTLRQRDVSKLNPYRNNWHERVIREEVKKAAQDGKRKLQFPVGETAMKIEGLGSANRFTFPDLRREVTPGDLRVGTEVVAPGLQNMIITDVLGDGKFKAIPKEDLLRNARFAVENERPGFVKDRAQAILDGATPKQSDIETFMDTSLIETFDISGKVDTNNPIYKFYEKDVGSYLQKKLGAKRVTDAQGVDWWEVDVKPGAGKAPVEAFGVAAGLEEDEEGNVGFNPKGALLGLAGASLARRGGNFLGKEGLEQLRMEVDFLKEALQNHPARFLAKFTNKRTGELPEVLGKGRGKFRNMGDEFADQAGFPDSETARRSFEDYQKGQKRLVEMQAQLREAQAQAKRQNMSTLKTGDGRPVKLSAEGIPLALSKREREILNRSQNRGALQAGGQAQGTPPQTPPPSGSGSSPKVTPLLSSVSEGEARSIQQLADQALSRYESTGFEGGKPLIDMVEDMQTPVNKKVNVLDYFRTPDRVLNKIGLGREAAFLRRRYDGYLKELPKNIDKITEWSKRVPKASNERIFKYLDGQPIDLRPDEKEVALEIRSWLSKWADRLKLPKGKRITNYITHLFDDQLVQKEFDEDLAKIISSKIPGEVYDPFLQKRLGELGYKQDTWAALDAYVKRGTRKFYMDPALEKIEGAAEALEESQWNYVKNYTDRINLRPTEIDNLIDNAIKSSPVGYRLGQRPTANITRTARQMVYRGLLGLNPGSALKNLSQGANTYAKLGEKYTAIGYTKLLSPANHKELAEQGVLNAGFIQDRTLTAAKEVLEKADKGLWAFFDMAERINRGAAYFGAKAKALNRGMSEEQAIKFAKKTVRDTQFSFGSVDTPQILQSDIMKTLGQFQSYSLKQTEFLAEMARNKEWAGLMRYGLAGVLFVSTIGKMFGMEPKDLIPTFRFDTPPTLQAPLEIGKAAFNIPDKFGNTPDTDQKLRNVGRSVVSFIPGGGQARKTIEGVNAYNRGASVTAGGNVRYPIPQTTKNRLKTTLFGQYSTDEAREYFSKRDAPKEREAKKVYNQVQRLLEGGGEAAAREIVDGMTDEQYAEYKKVRASDRRKKTLELQVKMMPTVHKIQSLVERGREDEAQKIVNQMTDDEYKAYQSAKKKVLSE